MNWLQWKLHFLRCELIYALGGVPREHIGTVHYRNIVTIMRDLRERIRAEAK